MADKVKRNDVFSDFEYTWIQTRDCVKGSNAVKRRKEIYLPMPSGMALIGNDAVSIERQSENNTDLMMRQMPWYHSNSAYRAYVHRARFPDITGMILRGLNGVATKQNPEIDLPSSISYLEEAATTCVKNLDQLYSHSLDEVFQTGKICYVLDVDEKSVLRIAVYSAERNADWKYDFVDGVKKLVSCTFIEEFGDNEEDEIAIEYKLENDIAVTQRYRNGKEDGEEVPLTMRGKTLSDLPIFFATPNGNTAVPNIVPLLGISDIALTIYRKDADLSQAQYMTCNPTLFIFGVNEDQKPTMLGSTVTVAVSNPNASAEYPATDTSALDHVKGHIGDLYQESVMMGAQFLGVGKKAAESGEALAIREASSGATLVGVAMNCSLAIEGILKFAAEWSGASGDVTFDASLDFANKSLTAQDITALVSSWVQNAISHDTLLDNLRDSNVVDPDRTNQQERAKIVKEQEDLLVQDVDDDKNKDGVTDE